MGGQGRGGRPCRRLWRPRGRRGRRGRRWAEEGKVESRCGRRTHTLERRHCFHATSPSPAPISPHPPPKSLFLRIVSLPIHSQTCYQLPFCSEPTKFCAARPSFWLRYRLQEILPLPTSSQPPDLSRYAPWVDKPVSGTELRSYGMTFASIT